MAFIHTEIDIDAPPAKVWDTFHQLAKGGTPLKAKSNQTWLRIDSAETAAIGSNINVFLRPEGKTSDYAMTPKLLKCDKAAEFRWCGTFLAPWIVSGEHHFKFESLDGGKKTHFVHGEEFRGCLIPLFLAIVGKDATKNEFIKFNEILKKASTSTEKEGWAADNLEDWAKTRRGKKNM